MLFDEALQYLLGLGHETLAIKLGLRNIELLLNALGRPQDSFESVQVAGTNGKGSVTVVLDHIARAAGIKSGLYTSPHLVSITERIRVSGRELRPEDFARVTTEVRRAAQRLCDEYVLETLPTFFEHVTAIALLAFKDAGAQLGILETGLGGRLDATTAVGARTVAITPVSLDHQEYLGSTLAEIAAEKAAIIGAGTQAAVIAPQPPEALKVIERFAALAGLRPFYDDCRVEIKGADADGRMTVNFHTPEDRYENVHLGLLGRHQATNVAVAIRLAECLRERGFDFPHEAIIEGVESARHAGRLELWEGAPAVLFDGAHNVAGARALVDYLREFVKAPVTLIFGAMRDKDLDEIAALLFPQAEHLILTEIKNARSYTLENLERAVPQSFDSGRIIRAQTAEDAVRLALEVTEPQALICVTGSLYLIGEIQGFLSQDDVRAWLPIHTRKS